MLNWTIAFPVATLLLAAALFNVSRRWGPTSLGRRVPIPSAPTPPYLRCLNQIQGELQRARRYRRKMSVVVLRPAYGNAQGHYPSFPNSGNGRLDPAQQAAFIFVGSLLRSLLRSQDIVAYRASPNQYLLALVESDENQALQTVARLRNLIFERTQLYLEAGVAEFPTRAVTFEDLVRRAEQACGQSPVRFKARRSTVTGATHARTATRR